MTPPTAALSATPPRSTSRSEASVHLKAAGGEASRYRAAAVIVPPTILLLGSILGASLAASGRAQLASAIDARSALLVAVHMLVLTAALALVRGLGRLRAADLFLLPGSAALAFLLDVAIPGARSSLVVPSLVASLSAAAQPLGGAWRRRWERIERLEATLVLSTAMDAPTAIERLERVPGLRISSLLIPGDLDRRAARVLDLPIYSHVVPRLCRDRMAIVSCPGKNVHIDALVARLVARGYDVESESSILRRAEGRIDSKRVSPLNLLLSHPRHAWREWLYRARDLAVAVPGLLLLAPVFALVWILIRVDSRGPAFFLQQRLGARGRPFKVIKFRTMRQDAESSTGPVWASERDPRITRVGAWLRRTRIDELPQLLNVALGQMSLVGPRPERAHFFRRLRPDVPMFELRTALRPGLTGWAQIRGTYAAGVEEARAKLDLDLYYFTRRSLWFDTAILFDTFAVAFSGRGAR